MGSREKWRSEEKKHGRRLLRLTNRGILEKPPLAAKAPETEKERERGREKEKAANGGDGNMGTAAVPCVDG